MFIIFLFIIISQFHIKIKKKLYLVIMTLVQPFIWQDDHLHVMFKFTRGLLGLGYFIIIINAYQNRLPLSLANSHVCIYLWAKQEHTV